jgi:hypothetical protein
MSRLVKILAYGWAAAAMPIILATFIGMGFFARELVKYTSLKVSPIYTGGETVQTIKHEGYETMIHQPVFDGLLCESRNGFVQIRWKTEGDKLPDLIDEEIDFDADGNNDFRIEMNTATNKNKLESYNSKVISAGEVLVLKNERMVRVSLKKD